MLKKFNETFSGLHFKYKHWVGVGELDFQSEKQSNITLVYWYHDISTRKYIQLTYSAYIYKSHIIVNEWGWSLLTSDNTNRSLLRHG